MKSRVHLGRALFYCLHCINRTCVSSHFNNFLSPPSPLSSTLICCMAIRLSLTRRSPCGRPWLMNTALRFSMFGRQISSLMVA